MSPSTSPSKRSHLRKSSSTIILRQPSQSELDETNALVESLLQQNQALRSQVSEIRTMLDAAQEETVRLRSDLEQSAFGAAADTSLADEVFSTASLSIPPSPAAAPSSGIMSNERPELRRRGSSSTSDSEAPSIMSYNLPNGSSKPAFGQLAARRRRGLQGPSVQPGGQRPRPQSMQAASKSSRSSQRNLSVDMGNLYNPTVSHRSIIYSVWIHPLTRLTERRQEYSRIHR